ncbi:MAG: hypothetical protein Q8N83_03645 [Ignavibacteria bacterium]|nr:hypothetical protein [Ignavibacteria bacterium]
MSEYNYWLEYYKLCWYTRQYYKKDQSKLVFWFGGLIIMMLGVTGLWKSDNSIIEFHFGHIIIFNFSFAVIWFYMLYKQLNAEIYDEIGRYVEKYIVDNFVKNKKPRELNQFFVIKHQYLGSNEDVSSIRYLYKIADSIMIILYLAIVTSPYWKVDISASGLKLDSWLPLISVVIFLIILFYGLSRYKHSKREAFLKIKNDWENV